MTLQPNDSTQFRVGLGYYPSGLTIVTGHGAHGPVAMTVQSFMSLSLAPPLVALGIGLKSGTWAQIRETRSLCINVLRSDQFDLACSLGRPGTDKLDEVSWGAGREVPHLVDAHAWFECVIDSEVEAGDHYLVVASVQDIRLGSGDPVLYHQSRPMQLAGLGKGARLDP